MRADMGHILRAHTHAAKLVVRVVGLHAVATVICLNHRCIVFALSKPYMIRDAGCVHGTMMHIPRVYISPHDLSIDR